MLAIIFSVIVSLTQAQGNLGTITGSVVDQNGDAIVGATVTVTNISTGIKRTAAVNESGSYTIPNLVVGNYTVVGSANGFEDKKIANVKVSVASTREVKLVLSVGGAAVGEVEITAGDDAISVNTSDQQLSTLISNEKMLDLPLLSRNPNVLVLLAPGVTPVIGGQGGVSVGGQRERNNNFLLDGVDNNDASVPGLLGGIATPSIDATEEFRVITNGFLPEYGRNSGASITVATKGGTNEFHGGAYIYYQSDRFNARNFFDASSSPSPFQKRQYGMKIGGPIYFLNFGEGVPAIYKGQEKSFFFFNIERDIDDRGRTLSRTVPSAQARQGIFDLTSLGLGVIDARQGSSNNRLNLPINPSLQAYLNLYPLGNSPGEGSLPGVFDRFRFGTQENDKSYQHSTRIDHKFNDDHSIMGSLTYGSGTFEFCCETFPGLDDSIKSPQTGYTFAMSVSSAFGGKVFNEFRFGANQRDTLFTGAGDERVSTRAADAAINAISGAGSTASNALKANRSYINFTPSGLSSLASFNTQGGLRATTTISDFVTVLSGDHQYKFGVEARFVKSTGPTNFGRQESLNFNFPTSRRTSVLGDNQNNPLSRSGILGRVQNFASYLYGLVHNQRQSQYFDTDGNRREGDARDFRQKELDFFFQDQWKIKPNLTFIYGTRYEYKGVPYEVNGLLSTLVDQDPSLPTPEGGFEFKILRKGNLLYNNDYNNWAPRIGFAYSPSFEGGFLKALFGETGDTSIRGNYGIYYDRVFGNLFSNARGNAPFQRDFNDFPSAGNASLIQNIVRPPTQTPSRFVQERTRARPVLFPLLGNNIFQDKFATPYTQSWSLSLQRQLFASKELSVLLEASYVGTKSLNQLRVVDGNRTSVNRANLLKGANNRISPASGFSNYQNGSLNQAFRRSFLRLTVGNAIYHSGQFRVTNRLSSSKYGNGEFQATYTLSRSIDDATDPLTALSGERSLPRDSSGFVGGLKAERGDSAFDARHNFVFNGTYELPFESTNSFVNYLISGFKIAGVFRYVSGRPYSAFSGNDSAGTSLGQRADFVGAGKGLRQTVEVDPRTQTGLTRDFFADPNPDANNTVGRQGTSGRSAFRGPSFSVLSMSVAKKFKFGEDGRYAFSVRADAFNLLNNVNFKPPINNINSANFGRSTEAEDPRQFQFAARFDF